MLEGLTTPGTVLLGKFRVERVLGRGAMGLVISATNIGLDQQVAIKFMLPGKGHDTERHERFMREARIAARLTNQHIAKVLDVGRLEDHDAPYLVMEHLRGQDLDTLLEERGVLPIAEAVSYVLQMCEGLAEAHKAGIVHRDLKPANLFLTRLADGSPCIKVLDFGVSKLTETGADLTQERGVLGSPLYMSPEQMQASREVDSRSDVWALGVVLYQLVAGKTPFHGDGIQQVCARVFQGEPTPLAKFRPDAPAGFEAVLFHCFEKDRERRWQNVAELAAALVPFGPARAVVHAERAAAILDLDYEPPRLTDVLPPEPSRAASEGAGGTLDIAAELGIPPQRSGLRRRPVVALALGLGLAALGVGALASVGLARMRGEAPTTPDAVSGVMPTTAVLIAPPATSPPPIVPPMSSSAALVPVTSAAASATAVPAVPRSKPLVHTGKVPSADPVKPPGPKTPKVKDYDQE